MKTKILIILILIAPEIIGFSLQSETKINKPLNIIKLTPTDSLKIDTTKLTKELFVKYLIDINVKHPEVAYAIAKQESAFKSKLFVLNKNLFGMRHPAVRPTKSLGSKSGYAHFETWQHSVDDYKLYLEYVGGHNMDKKRYLRHLSNNYASNTYVIHISKHFDEFHEIKNKIINDTIN